MNEKVRRQIVKLIMREAEKLRRAVDAVKEPPVYPNIPLDELESLQHELPLEGFFWSLEDPTRISFINVHDEKESHWMTIESDVEIICRLSRWEPDRIKTFVVRLRELVEWCYEQRTLLEQQAQEILKSQSESMEWLENEIVAMKVISDEK